MIEKDKQRHGECFCGSVTVSAELPRERTARAAAKLNSGGSALAPLPNLQLTDRAGRPEPRRGEKKGNKTKTIASKAVRLSSVHQLDRCSAHFYTCCATLRGNVRVWGTFWLSWAGNMLQLKGFYAIIRRSNRWRAKRIVDVLQNPRHGASGTYANSCNDESTERQLIILIIDSSLIISEQKCQTFADFSCWNMKISSSAWCLY